jgi:Dolichyl-phosphate-mannose-protein mannosyltransferase
MVESMTEIATDAPTAKKTRMPGWVLPGLFVTLAFVFRLILGSSFSYYGGDAPGYTAIAKNLAAAHGYSIASHAPYAATDIRLPAYPALLALGFSINASHWSAIILNALLGAVSTLLVWFIARGLLMNRTRSLWSTGIAAFFFSTASFAGIAQSENLSVPAVLALVYFVLIRPPKSRLWLFVVGSALAWVVALTRDELVFFVVIVAIMAGRRAHLRVLGTMGLLACFLLGSGIWVVRNDAQVHRAEYVDSVMSDQVIVASMTGNLSNPLYRKGAHLIRQPTISPAQRSSYHREVDTYAKNFVTHRFPTFAEDKVKYFVEAFFPVPIYGVTYVSSAHTLEWGVWSLFLIGEYIFAFLTTIRWWKSGRRKDLFSVWAFPIFMILFLPILDPEPRFWLPSVLLLLPLAVEGVANFQLLPPKPPSARVAPDAPKTSTLEIDE